jgi:hypothetical protein
MISWDKCKQDFQWDGSWRDIYITPASLDYCRAIFPFLRVQPEIEFLRESGPACVPDAIDASFFTESRPTLRFRLGGVLVVFHFFTPDEIECDIDPREVTDQTGLDAVLAVMRQLGDLTCKRAVLTPENASHLPIISYDPESREFQYHEVVA